MDGLSAWFVLAAEYCNNITNPSTEIFNFFHCRPTDWARRAMSLDIAGPWGRFGGMAIATFLPAVDISLDLRGDAVP
jgi:hypothetical protein